MRTSRSLLPRMERPRFRPRDSKEHPVEEGSRFLEQALGSRLQ